MTIRTGIIGMGKMGRIRKRELDAHPGFDVTTLCDVNDEVGNEFPDISFHSNWREVLDSEPDAIVVCTYNHIVPDIVCEALARGIHVFSEKPPGCCVDDVKKMMAAETAAGDRILKFGFNHRFHYGIMEAKAIVESKRYGELLWARGVYGKAGGVTFENSWRSDKALAGGGILLDQGIHMLDLLRLFMGEFTEVKSFVETSYWNIEDLEDNAFALLKTEAGKVAMLHSSATQWKHKFSLDLFMTDGYVCVNGILSSSRSYGEESVTFARKQFEDETTAMGRPREESIYFDTDDSWRFEIEEFHDCITGKKQLSVGTTADALAVMQLIEEIYSASQ